MNAVIKAGLKEKYRTATNKLVLLDYDGTLVNFTPVPETTKLSGQLTEVLSGLINLHGQKSLLLPGEVFRLLIKSWIIFQSILLQIMVQ